MDADVVIGARLRPEIRDELKGYLGDTPFRQFLEGIITDIREGKLVIENGHIHGRDINSLLMRGIPPMKHDPTAEEVYRYSIEKGITYTEAWNLLTR